MKKGLVLEGGGMRGLFTAGVIDVLMENGVPFDGIVGVSAGAAFGCNYKSHQPGRVIRYNLRFSSDPRYMGWRSMLKTGELVGGEFAYHTVPKELDVFDFDTFRKDPMEFTVVCTDANTGEPVYHTIGDENVDTMLEWVRASASLPIVSKPVKLEGRELLDGGLIDAIPLEYFQRRGYERNVVVLTQPKGYLKRCTKLMPLFHLTMRRHPAIIKCMRYRHHMYNHELKYIHEQEILGNTLLIYPDESLPIGRTEQTPEKMQAVYEMGRRKGTECLERVIQFLGV